MAVAITMFQKCIRTLTTEDKIHNQAVNKFISQYWLFALIQFFQLSFDEWIYDSSHLLSIKCVLKPQKHLHKVNRWLYLFVLVGQILNLLFLPTEIPLDFIVIFPNRIVADTTSFDVSLNCKIRFWIHYISGWCWVWRVYPKKVSSVIITGDAW